MKRAIHELAENISQGKVVLYPTDTIWGLGCDPKNQAAVDRIFEIKKRAKNQPLLLLVDSIAMLKTIVSKIHPKLENILHYNTRPLTIIFDHVKEKFAQGIAAENGSVAIRIVQNEYCQSVIAHLGHPIVSTSANISQQPFPQKFDEISSAVLEQVDYISAHKPPPNEEPLPSSIARFSIQQKELIFLRE